MQVLISCDKCNYQNTLYGKYCVMCGSPLMQICRECGEENITSAKYCRHCGIELKTATFGIYLDRAHTWKDQFRALNWWVTPDEIAQDFINKKISNKELPAYDDFYEPWIFQCPVDGADWGLKSLHVGDLRITKSGFSGVQGWLIATRRRFAVIYLKNQIFVNIPFDEIKSSKWSSDGGVHLTTPNVYLYWDINTKGAGIIDVIGAFSQDAARQRMAIDYGMEKVNKQMSFMELIGNFLKEASEGY